MDEAEVVDSKTISAEMGEDRLVEESSGEVTQLTESVGAKPVGGWVDTATHTHIHTQSLFNFLPSASVFGVQSIDY
jgi:hypothetical protein